MRIKLVAALALVATPLVAAQAEDFTRDGETYHYVAKRQANGKVRLVGTADGGRAFDLTVNNRHVDGLMNGTSVAFTVSEQTVAALNSEVGGAASAGAAN